ncbi:MAG: DnaJ domain-containing protein [Vicinamibacterales bacterium]
MPASSFAEVLDEALARARAGAARRAAWSEAASPRSADPFLFSRPFSAGAAWAREYPRPATAPVSPAPPPVSPEPAAAPKPARRVSDAGRTPPPPAPPTPGPPPASPRRAPRLLTAAERRALRDLVRLGASLSDAFTDDELRREYRRLALSLHPDRHPEAPAAERMRLAAAFAGATDAYRRLRATPDVRH